MRGRLVETLLIISALPRLFSTVSPERSEWMRRRPRDLMQREQQ